MIVFRQCWRRFAPSPIDNPLKRRLFVSLSALTSELAVRAAIFAEAYYRGKNRKTGEPYFFHPYRVALRVAEFIDGQEMVAAAFLHDVMEFGCDYDDIEEEFGSYVAQAVSLLTQDCRLPHKESMEEYRKRLKEAPPGVKLIKCADIEDNAKSRASPEFMKRWFEKSLATLEAVEQGDLGVLREPIEQLARYIRLIHEGWKKQSPSAT